MSKRFAKNWKARENQTSLNARLKEAVRPSTPLKPRLTLAIRRIERQIQRLDQAREKFTERDKSIFARIVEAYTKHDMPRANVFANELAEVRKMEKMLMHERLALEQIVLRLKTVTELGDVVTTLAPTVSVLQGVRTGMTNILPQAESELGQIGNLLNGIIIDAGQSTGLTINFENANEDAKKILNEAATLAEKQIKEQFPESPVRIPILAEKTATSGTRT